MAPKNPRAEMPDTELSLKRIERFLRILTWQMFGLIAVLLLCLASWLIRPQPGRFQYIGERGKLIVVDTGLPAALTYELEARSVQMPDAPSSGAQPSPGSAPSTGDIPPVGETQE